VKDEVGYTLHRIQEGKLPTNVKRLKGLGSSVMEIISDYDTNTFRAVYIFNLDEKIYVLHCFQKNQSGELKLLKKR